MRLLLFREINQEIDDGKQVLQSCWLGFGLNPSFCGVEIFKARYKAHELTSSKKLGALLDFSKELVCVLGGDAEEGVFVRLLFLFVQAFHDVLDFDFFASVWALDVPVDQQAAGLKDILEPA